MSNIVRPTARSLFLCDRVVRYLSGKSDVQGIFTRAKGDGYPHIHIQFSIFCEFTDGFGELPFTVKMIAAETGQLVFSTPERMMTFPGRLTTVQLVYTLQVVPFRQAGVYFIELWCDNEFVADVRLTME